MTAFHNRPRATATTLPTSWVGIRLLAGLALGLTFTLLGASALGATGGGTDHFVDDEGSVHEGAINAIAGDTLVWGCNPPANDRFCPDRRLTRAELATILARAVGAESAGNVIFRDISHSVHSDAIRALGGEGIARGCNPPTNDRYCPERTVTRGEVAAFLLRALELPQVDAVFQDTTTHLFETDIGGLAAAGITRGCNPPANDRYCPDAPVTRAELASMVARAFNYEMVEGDEDDGIEGEEGGAGSSGEAGAAAPFPGFPAPGNLWWGASISGGGDPEERHEASAGTTMPLHRTFFHWRHRDAWMVRVIQDDVDDGRLPWVSLKTPSWSAMAAGEHDGEIDDLLRTLQSYGTDIWLTLHHEPEGGGGVNSPDDPAGPEGHLEMNRRVRQRMDVLGIDNVALAPVLMSWTWDPRSGRDPDEWWDPDVYDFVGVDHYMDEEASLLTDRWFDVRLWAAEEGTVIAVGEWGMRGTDAAAGQRVRAWYEHAANSHADGRGARIIGLSAFDSENNAPTGSWELRGEQLRVFRKHFHDGRTARVD